MENKPVSIKHEFIESSFMPRQSKDCSAIWWRWRALSAFKAKATGCRVALDVGGGRSYYDALSMMMAGKLTMV